MCDEIVVVAGNQAEMNALFCEAGKAVAYSEMEGRKCDVKVRMVQQPALTDFGSYGSYLLYGICMLEHDPDWVLSIEADYLISPGEAVRLREALEGAPAVAEVVTARATTLNYEGTRKLFNPDFKNNFTPRDGYSWDRPIGCRPGNGVFPIPFGGVGRHNIIMNCEGFIRLRQGGWGETYNSKFMDHNPYGLNLLRTGIEFEHLTFTREPQSLVKKLEHEYFVTCGLGVKRVIEGDEPYLRRYPDLDEVAERYLHHLASLWVWADR